MRLFELILCDVNGCAGETGEEMNAGVLSSENRWEDQTDSDGQRKCVKEIKVMKEREREKLSKAYNLKKVLWFALRKETCLLFFAHF